MKQKNSSVLKCISTLKKTLKEAVRFSALVLLMGVGIFSANAERKQISLREADPRFSLIAERSGLSYGSESFWFSVENNTGDEYEMVVSITLNLACVGPKSFDLGVNKVIRLKPNGRFSSSADYSHVYNVGADSKNCRISDGEGFTLYKGMSYRFSSIKKLGQQNDGEKKINSNPSEGKKSEAPAENGSFGRARLK